MSFRDIISVSNGLDPYLGPKCLQRLSADNKLLLLFAPTKSDSDVIFCLQLLSKFNLYIPLELTLINRSLVFQSYPVDRINTQ